MIFSLCYTSRRPQSIRAIVEEWRRRAVVVSNVEVIVSIDSDDKASIDLMNGEGQKFGVRWVVQDEPPFNCVHGWNKAAELSKGKVIICISDDFIPPMRWDYELLGLPSKGWIDEDHVVHVNDGFVKNLCTMPIITRKRYERFGYVFYPRYESMFCDTELTERAYMDGAMIEAMHLLFEHHHPNNRKRRMDTVDVNHGSSDRWKRGEMLYNFRKKIGFPIDDGPNAMQAVVQAKKDGLSRKYAAYVQATKDDFCLFEVCRRVVEEGVTDFFFCMPDEYWSGKPTSESDKNEVREVASRLEKMFKVNVTCIPFNVQKYRVAGASRIGVETLLRNDSLNHIQKAGFEHILILDGDELWVPGLLAKIDAAVSNNQPKAVGCHMVPVVGLPGYPIDQARDKITVYVHTSTRFYNCRSPQGHTVMLDDYGVIHFTACRKTMDEIIRKHRDSGHADDPDYDMEGWIQNTLPNVRPGLRNVHMFKKWQIWPLVRNWTAQEVSYIPQSIWPYLGIEQQLTVTRPVSSTITHHSVRNLVSQLERPPNLPRTAICEFSSENSRPKSVRRSVVRMF